MNRRSRVEDSKDTNQTLQEIDEMAKQYGSSTILASSIDNSPSVNQGKKKCCSGCRII